MIFPPSKYDVGDWVKMLSGLIYKVSGIHLETQGDPVFINYDLSGWPTRVSESDIKCKVRVEGV